MIFNITHSQTLTCMCVCVDRHVASIFIEIYTMIIYFIASTHVYTCINVDVLYVIRVRKYKKSEFHRGLLPVVTSICIGFIRRDTKISFLFSVSP